MQMHLPRFHCRPARHGLQKGVAAVEFAIVAVLFFTLLLGIMEFGRWLFLLNGANEATRLGARLGVVCSIEADTDFTRIKARMSQMTGGGIPASRMVLEYEPAGCNIDTCTTVTARIVGAQFAPVSPFFGLPFPIPQFPTSLPREYMNSAGNSVCPAPPA
ncbi:TadE/TadG family type IV pilus assembly protein [Hydrogenophaga sp.]|uniref:TadE/TadG family type IV pilus assembly protein n=1 Tax=Hydrogenophaga sp. TaxID=1904254 RepID=UPI002726524C|nr:TadE family protein [Hydrogenophaga sp.]MDO8905339.1 pilus assembly protein [Hydrogenophaga sp.]